MQENPIKLSNSERKVLLSLLENGSKTDAQIAREVALSISTANRIRKKLEREETLVDYIPVVSLEKIGINLFAVVMFRLNEFTGEDTMLKGLEKDPHVVYLASGDSSNGLTHTMMLGFSDMSGYHSYFKQFRNKYGKDIDEFNAFFIPSEKIIKEDYTGLVKYMIKKGGLVENEQKKG